MKIYISGGCKNGKSFHGQKIAMSLAKNKHLYYVATMVPNDTEDLERIERHKEERKNWGFTTLEIPKNINNIFLHGNEKGTFLIDSVTALLANEMFEKEINEDAYLKIVKDLTNVLNKAKNVIFISDYIFSDAFNYDYLTEKYKFGLGFIDRKIAELCDVVLEISASNLIYHKGHEGFNYYEKNV